MCDHKDYYIEETDGFYYRLFKKICSLCHKVIDKWVVEKKIGEN